jgi:hypothetical protein
MARDNHSGLSANGDALIANDVMWSHLVSFPSFYKRKCRIASQEMRHLY